MPSTEETVNALYRAFREGDQAGMLALLADDVEVRFLGVRSLYGVEEARSYFEYQGDLLQDVDFHISDIVVDGDYAAGVWRETARTPDGLPWSNHGVDVFRVRNGQVVFLHENNDVRKFYRFIPEELRAWPSPAVDQPNRVSGSTQDGADGGRCP